MWRRCGAIARRRLVHVPGLAVLAVGLLVLPGRVRADSCAAVCTDPQQVVACQDGRSVWGFREPDGVCRGGAFGYLESRESADAERLRLARGHKKACDEDGDCERFQALDRAEVVCLACGKATPAPVPPPPAAVQGKAPPCAEDEWLRAAGPRAPARCFVEFASLPPRLALQGRCVEGDCRKGLGTMRWPTGESYVGSFRAGKRDGEGTFSWPDGRRYVGQWRAGQPSGLGTRIYANGRYKSGYFERGRYLGSDIGQLEARSARKASEPAAASSPANTRSCEEACTEDSDVQLGRINDEYECCFARHAFCTQKAQITLEGCSDSACTAAARQQHDDCDVRYACDAAQTEKIARFRHDQAACIEGCSSEELDEQGLRVSERGTLYDE